MEPSTNDQNRKPRVVLLHVPKWKIPAPGETIAPEDNGPPVWALNTADSEENEGDYVTAPYGLLSLAAQSKRAGYDTYIFNLSKSKWSEIDFLIRRLDADFFGMTMYHANFRGVDAVSRLIKSIYPQALVAVGGPQATALPTETLRHLPDVDLVAIGEGEATFLEILARLDRGDSVAGLAGTAWRDDTGIHIGPCRPLIKDLDSLASPHDYFQSKTYMSSRGCPMKCTFCGSGAVWGKTIRSHSSEYVLASLQKSIKYKETPFLAVKDDTFTFNRRRIHAICDGIRERGLNFIWSCDTRADCLDEDLIKALRLAGCQRISIGVESASPKILAAMKKNLNLEKVKAVTALAKKYGIRCRYYMIVGGPEETLETIQESIDFLEQANPDLAVFCVYSVYPGSEDFIRAKSASALNEDMFFDKRSGVFIYETDPERIAYFSACADSLTAKWSTPRLSSAADCQKIVERLPDLAAAHADLAAALVRENRLDEAAQSLEQARRLAYPFPGLLDNIEAVLHLHANDVERATCVFERALGTYPHAIVTYNLRLLKEWEAAGRPATPLIFKVDTELEGWECYRQPASPGIVTLNDLPPPRRSAH